MSLAHSLPTKSPQPPTTESSGPAPMPPEQAPASGGEVRAQFDTPGHVDVGDTVGGEGVVVNGIAFSPGELAALVDYVGPLDTLAGFATWELLEIKHLLAVRSEDAAAWDRVTHGAYSRLAQDNDDHFAPGAGDGPDFESSFLGSFGAAFEAAQLAQDHDPGDPEHERIMAQARLSLYTAEHYLQDMFSAGHQVAGGDVEESVDAVTAFTPIELFYPMIAGKVFEREADVISRFAFTLETPMGPVYNRIDNLNEWIKVASFGAGLTGRGALADGVRKFVHERLEEGVEVSSPAHPEPWVVLGDHDLFESEETTAALQLALSEVRAAIELEALPGVDGRKRGAQLLERHRPIPTAAGQAHVDQVLADATANPMALVEAVVEATCCTIDGVMDNVVAGSFGLIVEVPEPQEEPAPEERPSYVPGF